MFCQVDVCSAFGGYIEHESKFTGRTTRSNANRWVPLIFPIQNFVVLLGGYYNFEVYFKMEVNGDTLWNLCESLLKMHASEGGRSEIRYAGTGGSAIPISLDMSLGKKSFYKVFDLLHGQGVTKVWLHLGKYQLSSVAPCELVRGENFL